MPGNVWDFFSLGWEELKLKLQAVFSRQGLEKQDTDAAQNRVSISCTSGSMCTPNHSKQRKTVISELCTVVGQSKCWVLALETVAQQMSWFSLPFEYSRACLSIAWLAGPMLKCLPFPGGSSFQSGAEGAAGHLAVTCGSSFC